MQKGVDYTGVTIVFFCHDGKGNFVMGKRSKKARDEQGRWDIGGGGLDFGMSIEETLKKEIKEEYGTDVKKYKFLGYRDVHRTNNGVKTHWVALDFAVLINPDKVTIGEPHKFDDVTWFTLDTIPENSHSQFPEFLRLYKKKLLKLKK